MARPMVTFIKRSGKKFVKFFNSRTSAARAIKAWRSRGGKVASSSSGGRYMTYNNDRKGFVHRVNINHEFARSSKNKGYNYPRNYKTF